MNLAIFDFCDTISNFQTADAFSRYALKKMGRTSHLKLNSILSKLKIYSLLSKLKIQGVQKKLLLSGIKGLHRDKIDSIAIEYYKDVVKLGLNKKVVQLMLDHLDNGDRVIINSGGFMPYLKVFANEYNIAKVYATEFEYKKNRFTGNILGVDCLSIEKVKRMKEYELLEYNFNEIIVYSDSVTDLPLFNIATKKIVIIYSEKIPEWCSSSEFHTIKLSK